MLEDLDRAKVGEWQGVLDSVFACHGADRTFVLADDVFARDRGKGALAPHSATMPYLNTIPPQREDSLSQREPVIDHRIRSLVRWNVVAIVLRAGAESSALVGDVASFRSAARLCDVGFQHFFRKGTDQHGDDLLFILGHPFLGICARSFGEGRFAGDQLRKFRSDVSIVPRFISGDIHTSSITIGEKGAHDILHCADKPSNDVGAAPRPQTP
ncbi:MAG: hypothetical protein JO037_16055 [Actinobacteria bacterium]|nr:hypothetical protein [Actinomycetota bacterium]